MLPEAIAIVLSPQHDPSEGIFRLTDPSGLNLIAGCDRGTNFHPHLEPSDGNPIYVEAQAEVGGHVVLLGGDRAGSVEIVDLRKK
jgi:STAM-binding protein